MSYWWNHFKDHEVANNNTFSSTGVKPVVRPSGNGNSGSSSSVDSGDYASKEFVMQKIAELGLPEPPDANGGAAYYYLVYMNGQYAWAAGAFNNESAWDNGNNDSGAETQFPGW